MEKGKGFDSDVEIMYAVPNGDFYSREQLHVKIAPEYNRKQLPEEFELKINEIWDKRVASNPKLWNGTKFRIDSVEQEANCNGVTFNLGITSYKDFLGTNWSPDAQKLRDLGDKDHGSTQAYMSDALGVGALVETSDHFFILLRRSIFCAEAPGLLDIPGGHPEPQELVGRVDMSQIDLPDLSPDEVIHEIFDSTLREIVDEVNIPRDSLSHPKLIGVARNTTSAGRPSSEYYCRCSLSSEEVKKLYIKGGHLEADESTNIFFIPMSSIPMLQKNKQIWNDMAPSAKGCITLYQINLE